MPAKRVIISGGGTGGHLFPAIAIAEALKLIEPEIQLLFVGAKGKIEMDKVPTLGYTIIGLDIRGFQRNFTLQNLLFPFKLIKSYQKSLSIIKEFNPDVVVGTGGYASGPILQAAGNKNIPTLIQEQNSYPGITNKLLGKKAKKVCVAFDGMEKFFDSDKIQLTGNPVRHNIVEFENNHSAACAYFGFTEDKKTILVVGGSGGSKTLNESVLKHLDVLAENNLQVIWQTGKYYHESMSGKVEKSKYPNVVITEFFDNVEMAYAAADLIISRAGAGTISELCFIGKPIILVPSPNVAADHQTKNAMALVNKNAAIIIRDEIALTELIPSAIRLLLNEEKCKLLASNIKKLALPNAAEKIANEVLRLAELKN